MALPAVQLGVPYQLNLSDSFHRATSSSPSNETSTYHSLNYVPASHATRGKVPPVIDCAREASISLTSKKGTEDGAVELTFVATTGETNVVTGALFPSRNEFVLLFDGTSFTLHPLTSTVLSMTESKKPADRKRPPSEALDGAPDAKKAKTSSQPTVSPTSSTSTEAYSLASSASSSSAPSATAPVSFSLAQTAKTKKSAATAPVASSSSPVHMGSASTSSMNSSTLAVRPQATVVSASAPITPVSATSSAGAPAKLLTKSAEMRQAHLEEPDSDDSDDSD